MDKENILKVLDMSEEEQRDWVLMNVCKTNNERCTYSLADLAFRLRGEVVKELGLSAWLDGCFYLNEYIKGAEKENKKEVWPVDSDRWFSAYAKPIHWIIAALIARSKDD